MSIKRTILWFAGSALAALVGVSSSVIVSQVKQPATSVQLGIGPVGLAQGNLAFASYAARQQKDPKASVSARERALAAAAYRSEPLSSAALGMLVASMNGREADDGTRQALLDIGGKLTRRSSLINSASIEAAARSGDEGAFFRWLSRAILTNESVRAVYIRAMAQATARPGAEATLVQVLGPNPTWAGRYWNAVVTVPQSLVNAAKLRVLVARAPWRQTEIGDADRLLALRLTRNGHFDDARNLAVGLGQAGPKEAGTGNLVVNAQFDRPSLLPPIDWQLASSGNLGASIDAKGKNLTISAISGARGYAARQLVRMKPGTYSVDWALSSNAPLPDGALTARLSCAEGGTANTDTVVPLVAGSHRKPISSSSACQWFWFEINVNVSDAGSGFDAQLRHLTLNPVATGKAGQASPLLQ